MRDELKQLYQETILDHGRHPRNFRAMEAADRQKEGFNPVCGDQLTLYVKLNADQTIADLSFSGSGCAISMASASLMTETLKGKHIDEANALFNQFRHMVTHHSAHSTESNASAPDLTALQSTKLRVLAGVSEFPARVKCATLAWHTLDHALNDAEGSVQVSTE
jgi:nitrogen fixation NifU-like protein